MRLFHVTAIVPACVFLSGCGGGSGINSTSSSPTLNNLKTNTTFDRSVAILSFDENAPAGSAFSISYVASSKSYTLTRGTTTTTFDDASVKAPPTGEIGRNAPASEITYYDKSTATSTSALFLTKTGGANQTRYVGGGLWAHGDASHGEIDSFSYGLKTADTAVPRTGSADFNIRMLGSSLIDGGDRALLGEGNVSADFAGGALTLNGLLR